MTRFRRRKCWREAERCCHEVRFETRRCVKMRLRTGRRWGSLQRSFRPLSWIWEGSREGEMERAMEGKGTEGKGQGEMGEREKGAEENGNLWGSLRQLALGGIDAPDY